MPNAFASGHIIFPLLQAAVDELNNISWLSLWYAHIMSRYRRRSLRADFLGSMPFGAFPSEGVARLLMI